MVFEAYSYSRFGYVSVFILVFVFILKKFYQIFEYICKCQYNKIYKDVGVTKGGFQRLNEYKCDCGGELKLKRPTKITNNLNLLFFAFFFSLQWFRRIVVGYKISKNLYAHLD